MLGVALWLLSAGLGLAWPPGRYLGPAIVLLWIYLPQRVAFIKTAEKRRTE
jgi:hypothetical protein